MAIQIIGLIIGVLVLGAGIYYLAKEKHDPESRKIYTVVSIIGGGMRRAAVCLSQYRYSRKAVFHFK